jgi:tetratricopeptide (TPR) repeat protein
LAALPLFVLAAAGAPASEQPPPEATSLLGKPLYPPEISAEARTRLEENLVKARAEHEKNPTDPDALLWLGRRIAYLGRYRDAIAVFTEGVEKFPNDARFYRHRGHRYLTVREIDKAIADLEKAAALTKGRPDEVEPDGAPNPANIPRSTTQTNIWYHLGLGYYLKGDYARARRAWETCLELSQNDDMVVASSYWLYLTLRRQGDDAEALFVLQPIGAEMNILENHAYHQLLLLFKGQKKPEEVFNPRETDEVARATTGYGVAGWHLVNGRQQEADAHFRQILEGKQWAAFGYLAAEAELARMR